jgi:hypothetical protein
LEQNNFDELKNSYDELVHNLSEEMQQQKNLTTLRKNMFNLYRTEERDGKIYLYYQFSTKDGKREKEIGTISNDTYSKSNIFKICLKQYPLSK